jgi:hypothetical protein
MSNAHKLRDGFVRDVECMDEHRIVWTQSGRVAAKHFRELGYTWIEHGAKDTPGRRR